MQVVQVQGIYDSGEFKLEKIPPFSKAKITVIFTEEQNIEDEDMSTEEALEILAQFKGCIKGGFDYEKVKDDYFNEKYGSFN